jgi:hypothetical protein
MRILELEQNSEVWFDFRRGKIGGSKVAGIKPLKTGKRKGIIESAAGLWKIIAERVSVARDGESDRDRGHRLEELARDKVNHKYKLDLIKGRVWQSDIDPNIYLSPDSEEGTDAPVYAQETKAFDTHKHLEIIYQDIQVKKLNDYSPILSIPSDNVDQAVDYFVVNENLETLYWTLINDMVAYEEMECYVIVITRKDVEGLIEEQKALQVRALQRVDEIVNELVKELVK